MNKVKINTGLAAIMIVASIFAGWQTLLLVVLLMFIFCDFEDRIKDIAINVITFYVGFCIVSMVWDIVIDVLTYVTKAISSFTTAVNSYLDPMDYIDASKITEPINLVKDIADGVVTIMLTLVKVGFVISVLTGKQRKQNFVAKKINEYVSSALNYVSSLSVMPQPSTGMVQQAAGMAQQATMTTVQQPVTTQQPVMNSQQAAMNYQQQVNGKNNFNNQ